MSCRAGCAAASTFGVAYACTRDAYATTGVTWSVIGRICVHTIQGRSWGRWRRPRRSLPALMRLSHASAGKQRLPDQAALRSRTPCWPRCLTSRPQRCFRPKASAISLPVGREPSSRRWSNAQFQASVWMGGTATPSGSTGPNAEVVSLSGVTTWSRPPTLSIAASVPTSAPALSSRLSHADRSSFG